MLKASGLNYEKIIVDIWRMNAKMNDAKCIMDDDDSAPTTFNSAGEHGSSGSTTTLSRSNSMSELETVSNTSEKDL